MHDLPDNFVHLTGVIKRDAEARRVREGLHIMDFTIVVGAEEGRRGTYIDCEAYGPVIEATEGFVEEGELVTIEGRVGFRTWSLNKVFISGNLTRSPELRATSGGTSVLDFGVAVNERRKNQSGEWEDRANFVDCAMFGKRAEAVEKFLSKGQKVAIEGKLRYSSWEKDGQKRSKLSVIVDEIEFMSRKDGQQAAQQPARQEQPAQDDYDSEFIPF